MVAFTPTTTPAIIAELDFLNVMTYDLMNRRDAVTKHHTGIELSRSSIVAYLDRGAPAAKLNLGFAFYVKWFQTAQCPDPRSPLGCPTLLLEDPETGDDLGRCGAASWHDIYNHGMSGEVLPSYKRSVEHGSYDSTDGSYYYWDEVEKLWWTYDTPAVFATKIRGIVQPLSLGGVFAWGLGEDAQEFAHLRAVNDQLDVIAREQQVRDEL